MSLVPSFPILCNGQRLKNLYYFYVLPEASRATLKFKAAKLTYTNIKRVGSESLSKNNPFKTYLQMLLCFCVYPLFPRALSQLNWPVSNILSCKSNDPFNNNIVAVGKSATKQNYTFQKMQ
jgi:hypothetical protein